VSEYYEDTHPSMLRLLGIIIAEASGKPVTICGEMAGREEVIPTLLELGFRALSISPPLIPTTKELIRSIDMRTPQPILIESWPTPGCRWLPSEADPRKIQFYGGAAITSGQPERNL
jgi:signal transduction protein with GAF and PtsI domain